MVEIGCWLLEFDWIEEVVSMMHRASKPSNRKCVRFVAVDFFKVCLASANDSLDRRDRPTQQHSINKINSFQAHRSHRLIQLFGILVHAVPVVYVP